MLKSQNVVWYTLWFLFGAGIVAFSVLVAFGCFFPANYQPDTSREDRYVSVLNTQIRYRVVDHGGPVIILLHSFGGNLNMWQPLVDHLTYGRVISLDLIGFGLSGHTGADFTLDSHHRHLISFMDALNIDTALLVGSSMGASLAAWTAAHSPERVRGVALFAPSGYPGSMRHNWPGALFYRPGYLNRISDSIVRTRLFEKMFPRSLARQALEVTASYDLSFANALGKIVQPVLIVWSTEDRRVPFSYSDIYRKMIPHATFVTAPAQAGHDAAFYDPGETARLIRSRQ